MFVQGHSSTVMNPSILIIVWMSLLVSLVQTVFADDVIMQKRVNYYTYTNCLQIIDYCFSIKIIVNLIFVLDSRYIYIRIFNV